MFSQGLNRFAAGGAVHVGPIKSAVAGRTDHLAMSVPAGSYVIPADIVSGLGEGNTEAGQKLLAEMFGTGESAGAGGGEPVEILAAGGEYVIAPAAVQELGEGDLDHGHEILDRFVKQQRRSLVKTLKALPGPARD